MSMPVLLLEVWLFNEGVTEHGYIDVGTKDLGRAIKLDKTGNIVWAVSATGRVVPRNSVKRDYLGKVTWSK